ncbi:MAG: PEP-CTERM sorting domain-containing protein [Phycisphaerales bacterium]|nr:PEP-CTERM sorting domain-containing protein [Phycisphaerales bacterium]
MNRLSTTLTLAALSLPTLAHARPLHMNFEGMLDAEPIDQYYNGGFGGLGSTGGPNLGIFFSPNGLCGVDNDFTGGNTIGGDTANEPSGEGTLYWAGNTPNITGIMNIPAGFANAFSTRYSALVPATLTIHPGLNGGGAPLTTIVLNATTMTNPGDPNGLYTTWDFVSQSFTGIARSVVYHGVPYEVRFDDCIADPVPAPGAAALLGVGALAIARRRRG